jgi:hypothetical protein
MNPVLLTTFLFINSLVQQRKHKNVPLHPLMDGRAAANGSAALAKAVAVLSSAA